MALLKEKFNKFIKRSKLVNVKSAIKKYEIENLNNNLVSENGEVSSEIEEEINNYSSSIYSNNDSISNKGNESNEISNEISNKSNEPDNETEKEYNYTCYICNNTKNDKFILLSNCSHTFHVKCISPTFSSNDRNFCLKPNCKSEIDSDDLFYINNKFYKEIVSLISNQQERINILNDQFNLVKEELSCCYEYKQKLEKQRDISQQIGFMQLKILHG